MNIQKNQTVGGDNSLPKFARLYVQDKGKTHYEIVPASKIPDGYQPAETLSTPLERAFFTKEESYNKKVWKLRLP